MKKLVVLVTLVAFVGLSGCASVPASTAADDRIDYEKVALVNKWAAHNGVLVKWVNLPVKSDTQTASR